MSKRNRRQFLEDSMFAAAAAVSSTSIGDAAADDGEQSSSPGSKLGVAVVGARGRGGSHIGAFTGRKDTEILYVCDVDNQVGARRVAEVGKRQGREPQFVEDFRDVLLDPRVDIVSIATPNHLHAIFSIWAMQAGKDVYVEKPASHNVIEGQRMVEAARKYGRICQTGTQCRSNPAIIDAIQFVQDGHVGDVRLARGLCYKRRKSIGPKGDYPAPSTVNYDLWLGPAPQAQVTRRQFHHDWNWQSAYGNGDLGNQGIHQMDLARWGLGIEQLDQTVLSYGGRWGYRDAGDTPNTQVVIHDFGIKTLVFEIRGLSTPAFRGAKVGVVFEGTDGYVVIPGYSKGAAFDLDGNKVQEFRGGADHFANFLNAVRSQDYRELNADIAEGHLSSALCHLGNISYRLGHKVTAADVPARLTEISCQSEAMDTFQRTCDHLATNRLDPAQLSIRVGPALVLDGTEEAFRNHKNATLLLSRRYRSPFVVPSAEQV